MHAREGSGEPGTPVLIVDDDTFLADASRYPRGRRLLRRDRRHRRRHSPRRRHPFRLVITDLKLPDIQGDELSSNSRR